MKKKNIRNDFPFFKNNPEYTYLDSGLTSLKPNIVIDTVEKSLKNDIPTLGGVASDLMIKNYNKIDEAIVNLSKLINSQTNEIFFSPGATFSINILAQSIFKNLNKGDEIILGKLEHASNLLPWQELAKEKGVKIQYYELDDNLTINLDHLKKIVNENTKLISLAHVFNTIGTNSGLNIGL